MNFVEIEIDGKKLNALPSQSIIQVADAAGIYIPRFCYHPELSIAASCRMCLVEVEKMPKAVPACATPVAPNMKVFTRSAKALAAQRAVMEFLLINHPLDCPVCDQGGECELQDLAMGFGNAHSDYTEDKRAVEKLKLGSLIATEMTRCIHCTRCVRFGQEIAGMRELALMNRGGHLEISTHVEKIIQSEISGNMIDLCPVGALTSKPFRFRARAWEMKQFPSISPHDGLNSHLNVHVLRGKVMRVVPREAPHINQTWISDRDRFSYAGLYHEDRLLKPKIRHHGEWMEVDWETALRTASDRLRDTLAAKGREQLGVLASSQSSMEEFYFLNQIANHIGDGKIDCQLKQACALSPEFLLRSLPSMDDFIQSQSVLLIGSRLNHEMPLMATRLRAMSAQGKSIFALNPYEWDMALSLKTQTLVAIPKIAEMILNWENQTSVAPIFSDATQSPSLSVVVGQAVLNSPWANQILASLNRMAEKNQFRLFIFPFGGNLYGAARSGGIAMQASHSAQALLKQKLAAYLLFQVEPDHDFYDTQLAQSAFSQCENLIAITSFTSPMLEKYASVLLPSTPFFESSGSLMNAFGVVQKYQALAHPQGEAKLNWKILRALANFLGLSDLQQTELQAVRDHLPLKSAQMMQASSLSDSDALTDKSNVLDAQECWRVGEVPIYSVDALTRRAEPLQAMQINHELSIQNSFVLHPKTAERLKLKMGDSAVISQGQWRSVKRVQISTRISEDSIYLPAFSSEQETMGALYGKLTIQAERS